MSRFVALSLGLILALAPLAQAVATPAPKSSANLDAIPAGDARQRYLAELIERLGADFEANRQEAFALVGDEALPVGFRSEVLRAILQTGRAIKQRNISDQADASYRDIMAELEDPELRAALIRPYANLRLDLGYFAEAEGLFRQALALNPNADLATQSELRSSIGVTLAQQGRLDESLEQMLEAYRLAERSEDGPSVALLNNIGGLSIYLENWQQAERYLRLAIERTEPDNPMLTGQHANLAAALVEQDRLEEARDTLLRGLEISERLGVPSHSLTSNLGVVLLELGDKEAALGRFRDSAEIAESQSNWASLGVNRKNTAEILIDLGRREEADEALREALSNFQRADVKPKRVEVYPVLVENLEALGRYQDALEAMREFKALSEELNSTEAQTRIAELQNAFDLERKERELAESERERLAGEAALASLQARQAREDLFRTALLIGLIAVGMVLLVVMRALRLRTKANRLLAEKNLEIDQQHKALEESHKQLQRQSIHDELTGLGNRRYLNHLFTNSAFLSQPSLLILADLDRFKGINDRFGHPVGDQVLVGFAEVMRDVAGPDDVVVRWGGEEFLWLIAGGEFRSAGAYCAALAERLQQTPFIADGRRLSVTASLGVTDINLDVDHPQQAFDLALKIADAALYEAKDAGRDTWVGFQRISDDEAYFQGSLDVERLVAEDALLRTALKPRP